MTALPLDPADLVGAPAARPLRRSPAGGQDRVVTFIYRATWWCLRRVDLAERRTQAVFCSVPALLDDPHLDDSEYRRRLLAAFVAVMPEHLPRCSTAITYAAYLDHRDSAGAADGHLLGLLVDALSKGRSPSRAAAEVAVSTGVNATFVQNRFVDLLRVAARFTADLPI